MEFTKKYIGFLLLVILCAGVLSVNVMAAEDALGENISLEETAAEEAVVEEVVVSETTEAVLDGDGVEGYWKKEGGYWYFYTTDGTMLRDVQIMVDGEIYYLNADGRMATGWLYYGGDWYYFNWYGAQQFGWEKVGGVWYYLDPEYGYMYSGGIWEIGGYEDEEGNWIAGDYYWFADSGAMKTGWYKGVWTDEDTGETYVDWLYFKSSGLMAESEWVKVGGKWYYFDEFGYMWTGLLPLDGEWIQDGEGNEYYTGDWYYMSENSGAMVTGWVMLDGTWYYCTASGVIAFDQWIHDGWNWYYIDETGTYLTGVWQINDKVYYFTDSGAMYRGWKYLEGDWRYFCSSGAMVFNAWVQSGGEWYYIKDGAMLANSWLFGCYYLKSDGTMACNETLYVKDPSLPFVTRYFYFNSEGIGRGLIL